MRLEFPFFVLLCIGNGLCHKLVIHLEESCRVCVSNGLCDLCTPTNSPSSPQFGCSTTESNINFTYRHSNSNPRLFPAPRQCVCFSRVNPLIRHISESAVSVVSSHILMGIPDRRDSHKALYYVSLLRLL
jgi:hypothetical protein